MCRPLAILFGGGSLLPGAGLPLLLTHLSIFVFSLAYEFSQVVVPLLNAAVKGDSSTYADVKTAVAALQLCGGILFGRFGDVCSSKLALIVAHTVSALNYGLMAVAYSVTGVFISMVPTVLQHGFQGAQMAVTDVTSQGVERSAALSMLGMTYGFGAILGPILAGVLAKHLGSRKTVGLAACLEVALLLVISVFLPDTRAWRDLPDHDEGSDLDGNSTESSSQDFPEQQKVSKYVSEKREGKGSSFSPSEFCRVLLYPGVPSLLALHLAQQFSWSILSSMLPQFALDVYGMSSEQLGLLLSASGVSMIISRPLLACLLPRLRERGCILLGLAMACSSLLIVVFVSSKWALAQLVLLGGSGGSFVWAVLPGLVTQLVPVEDTGTVLGLDMATGSLAGLMCPLISNAIYVHAGFQAVVVTALLGTFGVTFWACVFPFGVVEPAQTCSDDENYTEQIGLE